MNFECKKFKKKPITVEAFKLTLTFGALTDFPDWFKPSIDARLLVSLDEMKRIRGVYISTLEGPIMAQIGDWIIKGIRDEMYPIKPDIFEETYEELTDDL